MHGIFFLQKIGPSGPSQGIWSLEVPNFPVALRHIYGDSYIRGFRGQSILLPTKWIEWKVGFSLKLTAKFNAPENQWLEDECPFRMAYFERRTVSFRDCNWKSTTSIGHAILMPNQRFPLFVLQYLFYNLSIAKSGDVISPQTLGPGVKACCLPKFPHSALYYRLSYDVMYLEKPTSDQTSRKKMFSTICF